MYNPVIRHFVSSPYGDVPVDNDKYDFPLEGDPLKTSYRVYFDSIEKFLGIETMKPLIKAFNETCNRETIVQEIQEIIIRAEKHGALYHPASIELIFKEGRTNFGLNVAISEIGKNWLKKEYAVLKTLHTKFNLPYIPKPYAADELHSMFFLLEEWFEDYHEFHIARTENGSQQVKLWAYGKGDRFLSSAQSFEIYRQASQILTCYYDLNDFSLIYPWHHAAGDFVVKIEDQNNSPSPNPSHQGRGDNPSSLLPLDKGRMGGVNIPSPLAGEGKGEGYFQDKIDVRLTTVRGYEPFMATDTDDMVNPALALFYFLLHLSIQMRLDKLDGVGDIVWADDNCVDATVAGFFRGLEQKKDFKDYCGSTTTFLNLLRSFSKNDLKETFRPILDQYDQTRDFPVIRENLEDHINRLHLTLQNFP